MNKRDLKKFRENYTVWGIECFSEGLRLAVHFDEKEDVKRMGARWKPDPSGKGGFWWMPHASLGRTCPIECDVMGDGWSGTVQDWLNNHKMIVGAYGKITPDEAERVTRSMANERYVLSDGASEYAVMRFPEAGLILFYTHQDGKVWYDEADGKETWNHLVASGFYRISEVSA